MLYGYPCLIAAFLRGPLDTPRAVIWNTLQFLIAERNKQTAARETGKRKFGIEVRLSPNTRYQRRVASSARPFSRGPRV